MNAIAENLGPNLFG
jgi:hypothetical protein